MAKPQNFAGSSIRFIGMLLPLLYLAGFIYYFSIVGGGTLDGIIGIGLGPTVVGLAAIGLLFAIKPLYLIFRFVIGMVTGTGTAAPAIKAHVAAGDDSDQQGFDADAAISRYLAQRPAGEADAAYGSANTPSPPARPGFGRKVS